jgi:hypothetical protein
VQGWESGHPFTSLSFGRLGFRNRFPSTWPEDRWPLSGEQRKIEATFFSNNWCPKAAPSPGCQPHICLTNCAPRRDSASQEAIGEEAQGNRHKGVKSDGEGSQQKALRTVPGSKLVAQEMASVEIIAENPLKLVGERGFEPPTPGPEL